MSLLASTIAVPVSVAAGAGTDTSRMCRKLVTLTGTFVGTWQLQITADLAQGAANWVNEGTALTAPGALEVTKPCLWLRWNCTAYTSGTPVSFVSGARD